jgi:hypothetical protein
VRRIRWSLLALGLLACTTLAGEPSPSKLEQEISFDIDKVRLESALIQFSRQAEMQVLLAPDAVANVMASAVKGRLPAGAALTELLKGTGLVYTTVGNTVMVRLSAKPEERVRTGKVP